MDKLPSEILAMIFDLVPDQSLLICERVCQRWKSTILHEKLYSKKCERILVQKPELIPTFAHHKFQLIKSDPNASKKFYYKLQRLSPWNLKDESKLPNILTYICKAGEVTYLKIGSKGITTQLEPEGIHHDSVYQQGIYAFYLRLSNEIEGLGNAKMIKPGYVRFC